jgi:hypothetical protein
MSLGVLPVGVAGAQPPSHASFVARADALCIKEDGKLNGLLAPQTLGAAIPWLQRTIAVVTELRAATLALPAPGSDKPLVRSAMAEVGKELAFLRLARAAAPANDTTAFRADIAQASKSHRAEDAIDKELGLQVSC